MSGLQISCTIPMCLAMRRSHQLVKICDVFLHFLKCTLGMHIEHPSITMVKGDMVKDYAPNAVNVRLYSLVLVSMLNCFCKPTLGSQVSASQLMRSTRQRERKTCHFRPYPHPIKFDFTRIYVETNVYIHLANSWDHDVMCPSLIFLIKKHVFDFGGQVKILHLTWFPSV